MHMLASTSRTGSSLISCATRSSRTSAREAVQKSKIAVPPSFRQYSSIHAISRPTSTQKTCRNAPSFLRAEKSTVVKPLVARNGRLDRSFSTTRATLHGGKGRPAPGTGVKVTFKNSKGEVIKTVEANEGDDIVDLSWEYDLDIEAACEKSIACSTCHVILDPESYDKLEEPTDEENDMLDMAFGLEDTSRLGCQVKITRDLDGMSVQLPSATRNFAVDGHKSKH